jgi:hypothetical protein
LISFLFHWILLFSFYLQENDGRTQGESCQSGAKKLSRFRQNRAKPGMPRVVAELGRLGIPQESLDRVMAAGKNELDRIFPPSE